jgi:hypothetical protein
MSPRFKKQKRGLSDQDNETAVVKTTMFCHSVLFVYICTSYLAGENKAMNWPEQH